MYATHVDSPGLSRAATGGSFVRPSRPSDRSQSFLVALRQKYVETDAAQHVYFNGKLAEEVGFDKIRRQLAALQDLIIVILDGTCIFGLRARLDDDMKGALDTGIKEVSQICPSIRQLDLSRNLLEHWVDVAAICRPLSSLSSLNLRSVRLPCSSLCAASSPAGHIQPCIHIPDPWPLS